MKKKKKKNKDGLGRHATIQIYRHFVKAIRVNKLLSLLLLQNGLF